MTVRRATPVVLLAVVGALAAGCDGEPSTTPDPTGSRPPTGTADGPTSAPPGSPVAYPNPLPDCAALAGLLPTSVYTAAGGAAPQASKGADQQRESLTCTVTGTLADTASTLRVEVLIERPLVDPVDGSPLARHLTARPEAIVKQRCPEFPYAPVPELVGGMKCYLRSSATQAQGLVAGSNKEYTALVTATVSDPARSPADLRGSAETAARTIAAAILNRP